MLEITTLKEKTKSDYLMMTFLIMAVVYLVFGSLVFVLVKEEQYLAIIILGFAVAAIIGLIARNKILDNYFTNGFIVTATVVKVRRYSRYPYFIVTYKINNEDFSKRLLISRGRKSREYSEGSKIKLIVDQDNLKKAIILSFYEH